MYAILHHIFTELGLTACAQPFELDKFEPIIETALKDTRHWSVNGFSSLENGLQETHEKPDEGDRRETGPKGNDQSNPTIPDSRGSKRHLYQNGCLVRQLRQTSLLSTNAVYVEFGAGRGGLSHWVHTSLSGSTDTEDVAPPDNVEAKQAQFVLVERKSTRYKYDIRHREGGNFHRLRMDIAHLDLTSVPFIKENAKPIVAVAKHLCGDATDLALRCLGNACDKDFRLTGIMFATCCHNQCSWVEAVGRPWLEQEAELTSREFAITTRLSSWATCGFERSNGPRESNNSAVSNQANTDDCFDSLTIEERVRIGRLCKRLIDWGRLRYVQHSLYNLTNATLRIYAPVEVTPENVIIIGFSGVA